MNQIENFRYIIAEERRRAGLTQEALASRIGITPQAVSKWENGICYPDITLFPRIADVLDIPISRLFGETASAGSVQGQPPALPETYGSLPLVCAHGRYACYTDKVLTVLDETRGVAMFADGSEADLGGGQAINRGVGELRVYAIADLLPVPAPTAAGGATALTQTLPLRAALSMTFSHACDIDILIDEAAGETCRVEASGTADFIAALSITDDGERLTISAESAGRNSDPQGVNRMTLCVGRDHLNLLGATLNAMGKLHIEPRLDRIEVRINGCADVSADGVGEAALTVNGAGDIKLREVAVAAGMTINGSGDITIQHCASPKVHINGSGDVKCGEVHGRMSATVNGAGDITCGGTLAMLELRIHGSGDFHGRELCVEEADIRVAQGSSAAITIGHIRRRSVERLSRDCSLTVLRRGEA